MNFTTIHSEGSLISADLLTQIYVGDAPGQKIDDFGLQGNVRLTDEIAACWSDARAYWAAFQRGMNRIKITDTGATVTREQWILPLLRSLGFDKLAFMRAASQVGGQSYFISHRAGEDEAGFPIHIEGANNEIDKKPPSGRPRLSPHALVQEYLNRTDHLWAVVTNGRIFRILRDSERLSRPTYLEFDLEQMLEGEQFSEFQMFFRLIHRSRWSRDVDSAHECLLENYYQQSIESGGRVRDKLRDGVEAALKIFGNGFLNHPSNEELRSKIKNEELTPDSYYRQLLRLIYRFLFLMVSEERRLVGPDVENDHLYHVYYNHYSITRFREKVERPLNTEDRYWDLWEGVKQTFRLYCHESEGQKMGIASLNGDLFGPLAMPNLENACLLNVAFLHGFAQLSLFKEDKVIRRINYAYLDVEELGSVYESLLDFHPVFRDKDGRIEFDLVFGTERKSTGSYYTRPELVQELIKSALVPVMEDRLKEVKTKEDKEKALLDLRVCDPAAGSGHFLLAAARRIGKELAKVRTGEEEPTPTEFRQAVREVIQHCIYGVDLNPLAVDLCKVALWLEGHNKNKPLTFLDHRIRCGNSLIGVMDLKVLQEGIPDDAFKPVTGDDKEVAKQIRKRNKLERESAQFSLKFEEAIEEESHVFAKHFEEFGNIPDDDSEQVKKKAELFERMRQNNPQWYSDWTACNIWTLAFFYPLKDMKDPAIPTHETLITYLETRTAYGPLIGKANAMSGEYKFFHWPLEFPDVMEKGGFDVVLGNPPWERIKLQEKEFFSTFDPKIANAPNKAARSRLIESLKEKNPTLYNRFQGAKHQAESDSRFIRQSGRFALTSVGDINTYAVFSELGSTLINLNGYMGLIIQTGIATDDTLKNFFSTIIKNKALIKLIGFENEDFIFPAVANVVRFCMFVINGSNKLSDSPEFAFYLRRFEQLNQQMRFFRISQAEIKLFNPNTNNCPVFRTRVDLDLTKKIYERVPVLVNEKTGKNPWGISFLRMFDMANDSQLFYQSPAMDRVPLYEAKLFWHYDHRFASYEHKGVMTGKGGRGLPELPIKYHMDREYFIKPRYWVYRKEVENRIAEKWNKKWFIVFRDVTSAKLERSAVFTIVPFAGIGHKAPIVLLEEKIPVKYILCLLANFNSLIYDYLARQKIGGTSLSYFILKQIPVFHFKKYDSSQVDFILKRVTELIFTSCDIQSFACDIGYTGEPFIWNDDRRALIQAELDAFYSELYGLDRDELRYILDPQDVYGPDFPGETFRVLKEKEIKKYGEYRTRRLVLEAWDRLFEKEQVRVRKAVPEILSKEELDLYRQYAIILCAANTHQLHKTQLFKLLFFIQHYTRMKIRYNWEIHHYGPYDRNIENTLKDQQKYGFIQIEEGIDIHDIRIELTDKGSDELDKLGKNIKLANYQKDILKIIDDLSDRSVRQMELLSTLVYVFIKNPDSDYDQLVAFFKLIKGKKFSDNEIEQGFIESQRLGYIKSEI